MSPARPAVVADEAGSIQNVCMTGVLMQIRDVDPDVRDRLKARAAATGMSLNSYLKELLSAEAALPSRAEVVERLRARGDLITGEDPVGTVMDELHRSREQRTRQVEEFSLPGSDGPGEDSGTARTDG